MKLAQVQMTVPSRTEDALAEVRRMTAGLPADVDLIALPEMFCCPYETSCFPRYAEPAGGPVWQACAELARARGCYLSAGSMPELGEDGRVYNTAYVFDRSGREIARHRKMHLFDIQVQGGQHFRESDTLTAGQDVTLFDTEFGKMGLCICYDIRFPELVRLMALGGAQMVLVPAAFNMTTGPAHWALSFRGQAMFNQLFIAGTSPARDMSFSYHAWGHSILCDPWGRVCAEMDERPGVQISEVNFAALEPVRQQLPLLSQRRTDLYELRLK